MKANHDPAIGAEIPYQSAGYYALEIRRRSAIGHRFVN
jgi:hypothetical protein